MTRLSRLALVLTGTALAFLSGAPAGESAQQPATTTATITTEAWYQPDPGCSTAAGCAAGAPPASSPYPAGTMHVGVTAGQETARAYLALSNSSVPDGATITGGTLTIALDTAQADGSVSPETAMLQVCTTATTFKAAEGSFDIPPPVLCGHPVKTEYVATPTPHLRADLAPLAASLGQPGIALALLPSAAVAQSDSWHVVFSATTRTAPPTPAPVVQLSYASAADGAATSVTAPVSNTDVAPTTAAANSALSLGAAPAGIGFAYRPPAAPTTQPQIATTTAAVQPAADASRVVTVGFAYPSILLLPPVLLGLYLLCGRMLTQDPLAARQPSGRSQRGRAL